MQRLLFTSLLVSSLGLAVPVIDPYYAGSYSLNNLGSVPGVPTNYGGLTFANGDANTLLIGGSANGANGVIDSIGVTRDGNGHVTGFVGTAATFSTAPNIDGGLQFGPGGVLFFTGYPTNVIGQIKPGSSSPDKTTSAPAGLASSLGSLAFVPAGFAGAGQLAIVSYSGGQFCQAAVTPDGSGTYNIGSCGTITTLSGGPEGILYVPLGSALFPNPSILVAEYVTGVVAAYELDVDGNPIVSSRRVFISGLTGAEGATLDPVTNDFLFSTFGGSNQLLNVTGFAAPPSDVPEPTTLTLLSAGLGVLLLRARRNRG